MPVKKALETESNVSMSPCERAVKVKWSDLRTRVRKENSKRVLVSKKLSVPAGSRGKSASASIPSQDAMPSNLKSVRSFDRAPIRKSSSESIAEDSVL